MFLLLLYLCSIRVVTSLSSQEDLSITKYSQIGCLILKSDKEFIANNRQENILLPYQTFSSPQMNIELCFRLCRRWIILMFNNRTNCICLHTINKPYEFNEYLGEFLFMKSCVSNFIEVFSLTDDPYMLPSLATSSSDDWSLDGCYYLHGIQTIRVDLWLSDVDYILAIDLCRKYCQKQRKTNYYSYFLSRKKSCYCLPAKLSQSIKPVALRKPLIHCSFLPYICNGFSSLCEKFYSKTNVDTLIKIDVQHHCSSLDSISFAFDRTFFMCLTTISLDTPMTFSKLIDVQKCLPLVITTYDRWNYLTKSQWITQRPTLVWIDRNSTYIFEDLLKYENLTSHSDHICVNITRSEPNNMSYEIAKCNGIDSGDHILCAQRPLPPAIPYEEEFHIMNNESEQSADEILICPSDFVLFNQMCYYVHASFIYNIRAGERLCYNQHPNSTLVKYDSHDWGNINATRFLGRAIADVLIEFLYYILENKLLAEPVDESNRRHWLRLLFGDNNDPNECVLRYFARSSGAFTTLYRCSNGGHPVCQSQPIRKIVPKIVPSDGIMFNTDKVKNDLDVASTSTDLHSKASTITSGFTDSLIPSNDTNSKVNENRTINSSINGLSMNDLTSEIEAVYDPSSMDKITVELSETVTKYRPLVVILLGPIFAFVILFTGIGLLIRYVRRRNGPYSTRSSILGDPLTKRSSISLAASDAPGSAAALLHVCSKSSARTVSSEIDLLTPLDNGTSYHDTHDSFELATKTGLIHNHIEINEDEKEPFLSR